MPSFDITGIIRSVGTSITISSIARTFNDYGDATEVATDYTANAYVEVMTGEEDEVKEGILRQHDIIVWVSDTEANSAYLITGNKITWSSSTYRINNVIKYSGHYEVQASKI